MSCRGYATGFVSFFSGAVARLPTLLSCESLVQEGKDLGDVELDILQIQIILIVLLHLEQIVQLEVKLKQATVTSCGLR